MCMVSECSGPSKLFLSVDKQCSFTLFPLILSVEPKGASFSGTAKSTDDEKIRACGLQAEMSCRQLLDPWCFVKFGVDFQTLVMLWGNMLLPT